MRGREMWRGCMGRGEERGDGERSEEYINKRM